jgi:glycosyltransferase involved in cell wall biosynthesis
MEVKSMKCLKILISAYACEPGRGSEPGVGWNLVRQVCQYHDVWVLTSNCHRQSIEAELAQNPLPNIHFVYLDPNNWNLDWSQEGKKTQWGVHIHYYLWQIWGYFVAKKLHREINFDLAHHVTYVQYARPSFISLLSIPFIWGPIGGGESAPKPFWKDFSSRGKIYEIIRNFTRWLGEQDPFVRLTARRSILAWATTKDTANQLCPMGAKNIQVYSQLGLPQDEINSLAQNRIIDDSVIRFVSIGRLLHWKGFHLGLAAFAQANIPNAEYWIVGEGPERKGLEKLSKSLGIDQKVKFCGGLPRTETLVKLASCHVLVHPSLHESGGGVCLEAMAAGRPVICLDLGGPGVQITQETGLKIPAQKPEQVVSDLALAMKLLAEDPELRSRMGQAGQQRVRENFTWESKGYFLARTYQDIFEKNTKELFSA